MKFVNFWIRFVSGMIPMLNPDSYEICEYGYGAIHNPIHRQMLKMQDSETGGVHHKVSCENFPGYVMPENETDELIVTPVSTTATADFCAAMAMAYEYYQNVDQPSQRPV